MAAMKKELGAKRFFSSKFFSFFGLIVLGFLIFSFGKKFLESRDIDREIKTVEGQIAKLEAKDKELESFLNFLNSDAFLEQEARLKFNLQKPGESVVIIPPSGKKQENNGGEGRTAEDGKTPPGNPAKWWKYFFKS